MTNTIDIGLVLLEGDLIVYNVVDSIYLHTTPKLLVSKIHP